MSSFYQPKPYVVQTGVVTPGHAVVWNTDGVAQDGGSALTPNQSQVALLNTGASAYSLLNAAATGPFSQFTIGFLPGTSTVQIGGASYGGASQVSLVFNLNGNTYAFPYSGATGTGNVVGPSGATGGDVVTFNGITGALISDSGIAASSLVTNGSSPTFASPIITGTETANALIVTGATQLNTLTVTGTTSFPTPVSTDSSTKAATTAFVHGLIGSTSTLLFSTINKPSMPYTIPTTSSGIVQECSSTGTITLPPGPSAGSGFQTLITNQGSSGAVITINPNASTVVLPSGSTAGTFTLPNPTDFIWLEYDGLNWIVNGGSLAVLANPSNQLAVAAGTSSTSAVNYGQFKSTQSTYQKLVFPTGDTMITGTFIATNGSGGTVTFPGSGFANQCLTVVGNPQAISGTNNSWSLTPLSKTQFLWQWSSTTGGSYLFSYVAWGW